MVAAISTINLEVVLGGLVPLAILVVAGVLWNVFCVMWLARRLLPADSWFERSIAEMGQSMGVTATGLLLLRVVDPEGDTDATSAFGYKQLMHEPFMGGGLWTSAAIPLALAYNPVVVFGISAGQWRSGCWCGRCCFAVGSASGDSKGASDIVESCLSCALPPWLCHCL